MTKQDGPRTITFYMCGVDWQKELGRVSDGTLVYSSAKDLKKHRTCWKECGIVRVVLTIDEERWMVKQDFGLTKAKTKEKKMRTNHADCDLQIADLRLRLEEANSNCETLIKEMSEQSVFLADLVSPQVREIERLRRLDKLARERLRLFDSGADEGDWEEAREAYRKATEEKP